MEKKKPSLMSITRMRQLFASLTPESRRHIFVNNELAMVQGDHAIFSLIMQQRPPFVINDHRLGIVVKGQLRANINLVEKQLTAGMLVFIGPGTIISPRAVSDDLAVVGVGLSPEFSMPFAAGGLPSAFNGQERDFQLRPSDSDIEAARAIIDALWRIVHLRDYNRLAVASLVAALMQHYDSLYRQQTQLLSATLSREQTTFDRFIYLVNSHAATEHQMAFYARKMCLTERYLGTVIRQASGVTAKEWIDRAIVTRIEVELRHSDKTIAQIADDLRFPNPSFFCKYFKRLTGQTPVEYRMRQGN